MTDVPPRPAAVTAFEGLSIALLILDLIVSPGFDFADLLMAGLILGLVLLVSRRRSRIARWIFTAITAAGFALLVYFHSTGAVDVGTVAWSGWALAAGALVQIALLWSPPMSRWLASRPGTGAGTKPA